MCGLEVGFDVCPHGWLPATCPEGCADDDPEDDARRISAEDLGWETDGEEPDDA